MLRHSDDFEQSRILFAGDLQDDLPARLDTAASRAHTQQFHHGRCLSRQMGDRPFSPVVMADDVADCDADLRLAKTNGSRVPVMGLLCGFRWARIFLSLARPQRRAQRRADAGRYAPSIR
ncbi:hypothetical protein ACNKHM_08150 [Shigella sonnei]